MSQTLTGPQGPVISFGIEIEAFSVHHKSLRTKDEDDSDTVDPAIKVACRRLQSSGLDVRFQDSPSEAYNNNHSV